jgi:hypothetical protein
MAYQSYTNDSDSQFAAQLDRYKLGFNRVTDDDNASAMAAFSALPAIMSLGNVMDMRARAHAASMGTRKNIAEDQGLAAQEEQMNSFLGGLGDMSGMSGEQRAEAVQAGLMSDPRLLANKRLTEAAQMFNNVDDITIKARSNALLREQQEIQSALNSAVSIPERESLYKMQHEGAVQQAEALKQEFEIKRSAIESGDIRAIGSFFTNMDGMGREVADNFIAISSRLSRSDEPQDRAALQSLVSVAKSLSVGRHLSGAQLNKALQYQSLIQNISNSTGVNLVQLGANPEADVKALEKVEAYVAQSGNPQLQAEYPQFRQLLFQGVSSKKQYDDAASRVLEVVNEIGSLQGNPAPEARQRLSDQLAILTARSANLEANYTQMLEAQSRELKESNIRSQMEQRSKQLLLNIQKLGLAESAEQRAQYVANEISRFRAFREERERQKAYDQFTAAGLYSDFGFDKNPNYAEWVENMESRAEENTGVLGERDF